MTILHQSSRMAAPMGAAAITGAATILLGRKTTQQTTSNITSTANRKFTSMVESHIRKNMMGPAQSAQTQTRRQTWKQSFSTSTNVSNSGGFVQWYEGHLKSRPVVTKSITGSILWGLGDAVAQVVPTFIQGDDDENDENKTNAKNGQSQEMKAFEYDYPRTARAVFFGFALHAPLSHVHFNFLEWMTIRGGFTGLSAPVFKTVMEQFVYWSWISNSLYHGAMGAMQGKSFQQIYDRIEDVLMDTQYAQWKFWIPVQLLNFKFVPVRHQLNVVLVTSVVWTALLSAWYPPEDEEKSGSGSEKEVKKIEEK